MTKKSLENKVIEITKDQAENLSDSDIKLNHKILSDTSVNSLIDGEPYFHSADPQVSEEQTYIS